MTTTGLVLPQRNAGKIRPTTLRAGVLAVICFVVGLACLVADIARADIRYIYDDAGRLHQVFDEQGNVAAYDAVSNILSIAGVAKRRLSVSVLMGSLLAAPAVWLGGSGRYRLSLRTRLSVDECLARLQDVRGFVFHRGGATAGGVGFRLERQRGGFSGSGLAPRLYGTLGSDPAAGTTTITGQFGLQPLAWAGLLTMALIVVAVVLLVALTRGHEELEWLAVAVVVGVIGLAVRGWVLRRDQTAILDVLTTRPEAHRVAPPTPGPGTEKP